jgi:uncharacterized membrane protein YcaP (DUF421 family)
MIESWIIASWPDLLMVALSTVAIYAAILILTRINGLQSFSKMSSFDFAITIAMGSVIASTIVMEDPPLAQGVTGLAVLFALQFAISTVRRRVPAATVATDNPPLLVMAKHEVISHNMDRARMSQGDLHAKLRMAGIAHPEEVFAVVFETTGDVSVVRDGEPVDPTVFEGVRDAHRLFES